MKNNMVRPNIFLSYTMRDASTTPEKLKILDEILSSLGNVFIDYLHNKSKYKQYEVMRKLFDSDIVILLQSPNFFSSPWVRLEIMLSIYLDKPLIILADEPPPAIYFPTKNNIKINVPMQHHEKPVIFN